MPAEPESVTKRASASGAFSLCMTEQAVADRMRQFTKLMAFTAVITPLLVGYLAFEGTTLKRMLVFAAVCSVAPLSYFGLRRQRDTRIAELRENARSGTGEPVAQLTAAEQAQHESSFPGAASVDSVEAAYSKVKRIVLSIVALILAIALFRLEEVRFDPSDLVVWLLLIVMLLGPWLWARVLRDARIHELSGGVMGRPMPRYFRGEGGTEAQSSDRGDAERSTRN